MNFARCLTFAMMVRVGGVFAATADAPLFSLITPQEGLTRGTRIEVQIATLHRTHDSVGQLASSSVSGEIRLAGARWPVELKPADAGKPTEVAHPGQFTLRSYQFEMPSDIPSGTAILEVSISKSERARGVLEVSERRETAHRTPADASERATTTLARVRPAAAALRRVFADRISAHEPIYFIYGPDAPAVKFQFSLKYKLLEFAPLTSKRRAQTLQFAFTQRSLWDINGVSSPFYDTSYMPELIYESLAPEPEQAGGRFTWLGFQTAIKHESNGKDGAMSRSLNIVYARSAWAFGRLDGWHLLAIPEVFGYVSSEQNTADIDEYRGFGKLHLVFGRADGPSLMVSTWAGKKFRHPTFQFDLTYPIQTKWLNFETYLLVQYFNGYGESLLSYRDVSRKLRAGISLVR